MLKSRHPICNASILTSPLSHSGLDANGSSDLANGPVELLPEFPSSTKTLHQPALRVVFLYLISRIMAPQSLTDPNDDVLLVLFNWMEACEGEEQCRSCYSAVHYLRA
jgi:hypothetical protein